MEDNTTGQGDDLVDPLLLLTSPRSAQTLLPPPLATAVSLLTATSSLSLRLGGLVGQLAISVGKITTLTGFEVTRAILEGILTRAGQDVVKTSRGQLGRAAAEGLLERALTALHQLVTTSSFLVSAGFQLGTTGINASLALGQSLLSALDALFGDTETSKAIATIIVLVQREVSGSEALKDGESVSLSDIFTSVVAFASLQRWGKRRSQIENERNGSIEVVWDIVVLADPTSLNTTGTTAQLPNNHARPRALDAIRQRPQSSASFMSAHGDTIDFEGLCIDDSRSFVSTASNRNHNEVFSNGQLDPSFKEQITSQLSPGSDVKISIESMTVNSISIEVEGDHTNALPDAPHGYTLISTDNVGLDRRRMIFQNHVKKRKVGRFAVQGSVMSRQSSHHSEIAPLSFRGMGTEIPPPTRTVDDPTIGVLSRSKTIPLRNIGDSQVDESRRPTRSDSGTVASSSAVGHANAPARTERLMKVKDSLMQKRSYKNLVDFWNNNQPKKRAAEKEHHSFHRELPLQTVPRPLSRPVSPSRLRERQMIATNYEPSSNSIPPALTRADTESAPYSPPTAENIATLDARERSSSRIGRRHKRAASVYSVVSATSETSLALHLRPNEAGFDDAATSLNRTGCLPGQYPHAPFAANAIRYLRFAIASYGQSFLRILGTITQEHDRLVDPLSEDPREHHSFSSYTRLPSNTVLLSSYVDPQGVPIAKGQPGAATVLVHYVSLDHVAKAVILTCRGTLGVEDILTDLTADYDDFCWQNETHQVHQGILAAARKLLSSYNGRVMATLAAALEEFPEYGLILCGHSLGGSVASLLAMLLAEPNHNRGLNDSSFVTRIHSERPKLIGDISSEAAESTNIDSTLLLPPGRPIHVYAYGPAAAVSPGLQRATRGLITTIIHGQDSVSYLSLGTLRDFRSVALAFRADQGHVKNEIRRRLWEGLQKSFRDGGGTSDEWLPSDVLSDDPWPWIALQGLRSNLNATKLLPPGDVFQIDSKPVLQRHFVSDQGGLPQESRTLKPAKHVTVTHVRDVESQFREIAFGPSMWFDHMPMRYEAVLETLEKGLA